MLDECNIIDQCCVGIRHNSYMEEADIRHTNQLFALLLPDSRILNRC